MTRIAQRYAKAIFEVAASRPSPAEVLDAVDTDLDKVVAALRDPDVQAVVLSPETRSELRQKVLDHILGDAHELSANLIRVVLRRRRQDMLPDLAPAFRDLLRESRGEVVGLVETAIPIDVTEAEALEARATELAGKKVTLHVKIVPDLIGGVRIRIGNTLYDGSVATALEDLERRLMEAPL